jgi:hypothetical protein
VGRDLAIEQGFRVLFWVAVRVTGGGGGDGGGLQEQYPLAGGDLDVHLLLPSLHGALGGGGTILRGGGERGKEVLKRQQSTYQRRCQVFLHPVEEQGTAVF